MLQYEWKNNHVFDVKRQTTFCKFFDQNITIVIIFCCGNVREKVGGQSNNAEQKKKWGQRVVKWLKLLWEKS